MPREDLDAILSEDPLRALSRKERKALLLSSLVALGMAKAGLIPSEIAFFGIKASTVNPSAIMLLVAGVVAYFLVSFLMHALPDFLGWWVRYKRLLWEVDRDHQEQLDQYGPEIDEAPRDAPPTLDTFRKFAASYRVLQKSVFAKAFILDLAIPCIVGGISVYFAVLYALS